MHLKTTSKHVCAQFVWYTCWKYWWYYICNVLFYKTYRQDCTFSLRVSVVLMILHITGCSVCALCMHYVFVKLWSHVKPISVQHQTKCFLMWIANLCAEVYLFNTKTHNEMCSLFQPVGPLVVELLSALCLPSPFARWLKLKCWFNVNIN